MTTAFPGMEAEPTVEPEIPCCLRVPEGGLCDWVEPECEYLDEDDRKKSVWSDKVCDEIHPDDMVIFVKRYRLFKEMQKRILFLKVRVWCAFEYSLYGTGGFHRAGF